METSIFVTSLAQQFSPPSVRGPVPATLSVILSAVGLPFTFPRFSRARPLVRFPSCVAGGVAGVDRNDL